MEFLPLPYVQGARSNGKIYYDKHYFLYQKNKIIGDKYYFMCKLKHCPARLTCHGNNHGNLTVKHNHEPQISKLEELRFKQKLRKRAATESEPLSSIYVEEEALNRNGALAAGQYSSVKMMMHRARLKTLPPIPQTLTHMDEILKKNDYARFTTELSPQRRKFYSGILKTKNKDNLEHVLYFMSPTLQQFVLKLDELTIQMDGTFAVVPRIGRTRQLFCIHVFYDNHIYPLVYALMEYKTLTSYQLLFEQLRDHIIPGKRVKEVMADYEKTLRSAVRVVFPQAHLYGCWFHFARAVHKRAMQEGLGKTGLPDDINVSCRMAMALALLPEDLLIEGIDVVQKRMMDVTNDDNLITKINKFSNYLRRWQKENISLWKISHLRTNSAVEAFHRSLMLLVGRAHPNVWVFVKFLQLMENTNACAITRVQQGESRVFRKRQKIVHVAQIIDKENERLLIEKNVEQFLLKISYAMKGVVEDYPEVPNQLEEMDEDECDEEMAVNEDSLQQNLEARVDQSINMCKHCLVYESTHAYIPCGHRNTCKFCVEEVQAKKRFQCPTCSNVAAGIFLIQ